MRSAENQLRVLVTPQGLVNTGSGRRPMMAMREVTPNLVFLEVQLPDPHDGTATSAESPLLLFTPQVDEGATEGFEKAELEHLLERLDGVLKNVRKAISAGAVHTGGDQHDSESRTTVEVNAAPRYLKRIAVTTDEGLQILPVERIDFVTARGPHAELHAGGTTYLIRERMQTLEERLDPRRFFRIHRSTIVRLDAIDVLLIEAGGDYAVRLANGERLKLSRGRRPELEQRLGLDLLS